MEQTLICRAMKRSIRLATIVLSGATLVACVATPDEANEEGEDDLTATAIEQDVDTAPAPVELPPGGGTTQGAIVPCPADADDFASGFRGAKGFFFYKYTILSSTPIFFVSEGRLLDNQTSQPVQYQITTSVAQNVQVTVSTGFQQSLTKELTTTVNSQIQASRTTSLNVQFSTTVPPNSRFLAEYGIQSYQVEFAASVWKWRGSSCEEWGWYPQSTLAPTNVEGWRLTSQ
jgi:hypothetical protein